MADKIINTFQQRRQLTQELAHLANTGSESDLIEAVRRMVHSYPGDMLIAELVKNLDTSSSQLRGGLGHLAALLPPEEVIPALRSTGANRKLSAQTRITAASILERFLGETLPPALLSDLSRSNEVALQSLREAVEESHYNRHILLEYVTQMRQAGEPVAHMILGLLDRLPSVERIDLLRLMAMDDRPAVAHAARLRLERLAVEHESAALAALYALQTALPPDEADQVERSLRKLAFGGRRYTPSAADGWRALLSPADMGGSQSIWFVRMPTDEQADGLLMGIVINARAGILQAFVGDAMRREQLPTPHVVGELVSVNTDSGSVATLLEAPFDFCRGRLLAAQAQHWQTQPRKPLPDDYALYQDQLGVFAPPRPDPALNAYFDPPTQPGPLPTWAELDSAARELFAHPAMNGWMLHQRSFLQNFAPTATALGANSVAELTAYIVRELAPRAESSQIMAALADGLVAQAAWLHIAGSVENAPRAALLADATRRLPLTENPFFAHLVERSLHAAGLRR